MATDTPLFEPEDLPDLATDVDAPPVVKQLAQRAEERGISLDAAIGERIEHHQWRVEQVYRQREAQRTALKRSIERMTFQLDGMRAQLSQVDAGILQDTEHDRMILADIAAYLFDGARRKSLGMGHAPLGSTKRTVKEAPEVRDRDALAELMPEYTKRTLDLAAAKRALQIVNGHAVTPEGEIIPHEIVGIRPGSVTERPWIELPGKIKVYLDEPRIDDGNGGEADGDNGFGDTDPFAGIADPFGE